jgi:hypothetical protein
MIAAATASPSTLAANDAGSEPKSAAVSARRNTTKANTKQLTTYLSVPAYKQLRDIANAEDTKMHPLILEGLDMLFKSRSRPQIARTGSKD